MHIRGRVGTCMHGWHIGSLCLDALCLDVTMHAGANNRDPPCAFASIAATN